MNDYKIITDSTSDLPLEIIKTLDIEVISMKYIIGSNTYYDDQSNKKEFYNRLRNGILPSTTQINIEEFKRCFSYYLEDNRDLIYIGLSSSFSGMYNNAVIAGKELSLKYPDRKIKIIDSLSASLGLGMLVYCAAKKKLNGSSLEEVEQWVNNHKKRMCHWFMVDDLYHLKRGGRISSAHAVLGSMLNFKPLLFIDNKGSLSIHQKIRGRQKTIDVMISKLELMSQDIENKTLFISHGDCLEDSNCIAKRIYKKFKVQDIIINHIGPIIGSHTGAGTLALFFLGNSR